MTNSFVNIAGKDLRKTLNRCRHQKSSDKNTKDVFIVCEAMQKQLEAMAKELAELKHQNTKLAKNSITNNTTITNNVNNIVIRINSSHLSSDFIEFCLKNNITHGIPALVQCVHFNPEV